MSILLIIQEELLRHIATTYIGLVDSKDPSVSLGIPESNLPQTGTRHPVSTPEMEN